jgi:GntR family transcriptional regulator/MocR family aminotransferase
VPVEQDQSVELLLALHRDGQVPLGAQIEDQLREAIRAGTLGPGTRLPSSRDLAGQLGVSRGVVVNAYRQLAAEGYLAARQGAPTSVSTAASPAAAPASVAKPTPVRARFDLRPGVPDTSAFPRNAWLRSVRRALATMPDVDLGYGDPRGVVPLRSTLAQYLGRVRGVLADPARIIVTNGYAQGQGLVCRALAAGGVRRIAVEDPSHPEQRLVALRAGLELVPIGVDEDGLRVEELDRADVGAVIVTPAHQFPTGSVLAGERRAALLDWLRERNAVAIEDDYDAEYRYDRLPVGALQGLEPDRIVYGGSASKTLAPALRIGWLVVPEALLDAVVREKRAADLSTAHIEQYAFADFIACGELDRHLRRMRILYRRRRDALVEALAEALPEAVVEGIAAGLHAAVRLPESVDEDAILDQARRRRIALSTMREHDMRDTGAPVTLLLGYSQSPEPTIRLAIEELAQAIQAARRWGPRRE